MSPIKDLSEIVRLPRLGKIHLGTRHPEKGYPIKADHFVLPKDHVNYKQLVTLFGEEAKLLRIMIPVEDEEQWATQYYRAYNQTYGLVCKGDGENALRMVDVKTGELPVKDKVGTVKLEDMPCAGKDCPLYKNKKCHEVMNLKFLIPEVPGLGVWQIDTGSINSILNINSCSKIIKRAFGHISLIPLKLTLEPISVSNPEDGKKQNVYVLNLRTDVTMAELAEQARDQIKLLSVGDMTLEHAYDIESEEEIEDLWGEKPKSDVAPSQITEKEPSLKTAQDAPGQAREASREQINAVAPTIISSKEEVKKEGEAPPTSPIDLYWLREELGLLQSKGLKFWGDKNVISYLNAITKKKAVSIDEAVSNLSKEQANDFVAKVKEARELS